MTNRPNVYPGMTDKRVEFFACDDEVLCIHDGRTMKFDEMPVWILDKILEHIHFNPELVKKIETLQQNFGGDLIKKYTYYIFGGLNCTPDIDLDGSINACDFFNCDEDVPMVLCVNNGKSLSPRETMVLRSVCLPDKLIADKLHNSEHTILSHFQNIRSKTGLQNKPELTRLAVTQGII